MKTEKVIEMFNKKLIDMKGVVRALTVRSPLVRKHPKVGRNQKCPCGSDTKYKFCHGKVD